MEYYIHTRDDYQVKIPESFFNDSEYLQFMSELYQEDNMQLIIKLQNVCYNDLLLCLTVYNNIDTLDNMEIKDLTILINVSNFLNINNVFLQTIEKIRNIIRTESTESLRSLFNEKNDFSEQEEKEIKDKDSWCKKWTCHNNSGLIHKLYTT